MNEEAGECWQKQIYKQTNVSQTKRIHVIVSGLKCPLSN